MSDPSTPQPPEEIVHIAISARKLSALVTLYSSYLAAYHAAMVGNHDLMNGILSAGIDSLNGVVSQKEADETTISLVKCLETTQWAKTSNLSTAVVGGAGIDLRTAKIQDIVETIQLNKLAGLTADDLLRFKNATAAYDKEKEN